MILINSGALSTEIVLKSLKGIMLKSREETASFVSSKRSLRRGGGGSKIDGSISQEKSMEENVEFLELKKTLSALKFEKYDVIKGYSSKKYPFTFIP